VNHFAVAPGESGGTRHFEIGRELVRRDWHVTIAASDFHLQSRRYTRRPDPRSRSVIAESIDGVDFRWLWAAPYKRNNWRRGWNWLSFGRLLTRWGATGHRPDVVIGSSPHLFAAHAAQRLAHRWNVPFLLEVRDLWPESLVAAGGRKGAAYFALDRIARTLYHRADRIICLARGSMGYLAEAGVDERKLVFVPNGVDPVAFAREPRPAGRRFTLVYAGAHGPANGLDTVLDAADLLRERTDIQFVLIGDGPAKRTLLESARERGLHNVEFRDPVPKLEMPRVLAEADAGLMVLRDAPLFSFAVSPNKLFDYLGAGLPVVCNVPGEVADMARVSGAGEQAADSGASALAEAVCSMADRSPAQRRAMGEAGRAWVIREHGRPVLADRLDEILRSVVRG
jgi:glycosyltransferase involved in cell wall biosynthesis